MQKRYLQIKKFDETQMYKDRSPIWIKLHCAILDDYEFCSLPDETKFHAVSLMLLASRMNNKIPDDELWLRGKINANSEINLKLLIEIGFLEVVKGARSSAKKPLNDCNPNNLNDESVNEVEKLCDLEQNRTEENREEHNTPQQSAGAEAAENAPENAAAVVCMDFQSFETEEIKKQSAAAGNLSSFTLAECLRYVDLCAAKGDNIRNPKGLATNLFQTGKSDAFIRAALFPDEQQKADLEIYGEPIRFTAEPCRVCFGAKMADAGGKGYRKCEHCRNERGIATGFEPP